MNLFKEKKFWIIGVFTSFIGILIVKAIVPNFPENSNLLNILGFSLALAGLVIITFGTRRK